MRKITGALAFVLLLALVGAGAFLTARALRGSEDRAEALAVPPASVEEVAPVVEPAKPPQPYEGELNGFTFYNPAKMEYSTFVRTWSPKCTYSPTVGNNVQYVDEEVGRASRLNFVAGYLPRGAQLHKVFVSACEGDVINIQRDYSIGQKATLTIFRLGGAAFVPATRPRDKIEPKTIGNRPAVILHPTPFIKGTAIHLRDPDSVWTISGRGITVDELIKVAEGVR